MFEGTDGDRAADSERRLFSPLSSAQHEAFHIFSCRQTERSLLLNPFSDTQVNP